MPRYKLTLAYDGTAFHGWQKQRDPASENGSPLRTAQGVLEDTVRQVVREPVHVLGASRTDAGVHARGQVAAFSSEARFPVARLKRALNSRLPGDLQVVRAGLVAATFNPIGDATAKWYCYRLAHGGAAGAARPLFDRHMIACCPYELDVTVMNAAAKALVGEHDFASFARRHHGRESTVRTVLDCRVRAVSRHRLRVDVVGGGFLWNMVRIIAGTLVEVGRGRVDPSAIPEILAARDRTTAGPTMPPEGLCLMRVEYGETGE